MSLSIGIVGLPNVGKSTLFNALTKKGVPAENYPFCTIDPSVGIVAVPDFRLDKLADMSHSAKKVPAAVEFVDIAGLVKGASQGEGLGNQFLTHIREVDAIAEVVRMFDDEDVHHVQGETDPLRDIETIDLELVLADMQSVEKRLERAERDSKGGDKGIIAERDVLRKIAPVLKTGKAARTIAFDEKEKPLAKGLQLLTMKPILYVLNRKSGTVNVDAENGERWRVLKEFLERENAQYVVVDAGVRMNPARGRYGAAPQHPKRELQFIPISGTNSSARKSSAGIYCLRRARGQRHARRGHCVRKGRNTWSKMVT